MAVAIVVLALLLGTILVPLQTQIDSRKVDETNRILEQAREALLGYAAAYGYFPCPASATSNGREATGFDHSAGAANTCPVAVWGSNSYVGFLPAATLGLTPTDAAGYLLDGWGLSPQNRIRYAVSTVTVNAITQPFTRVNGMRNALMSNIMECRAGITTTPLPCVLAGTATAAQGFLHVCNSGTGATATACGAGTVTLTATAPVVIWSVGANAPTGGTSTDEAQNPNPKGGSGDRVFVMRTRAGPGTTGGEFDDILTWIAPTTLFSRLIAAGQLP